MTKRERKALAPARPNAPARTSEQHIHCIACGRHLDPANFDPPATATVVQCEHKSSFASCTACVEIARALLAEHDRTGQPVKVATAWH